MDEDSQDQKDGEGGERVAKALARAGVASRREVERLIEAGRVRLNGEVLTTPAVKVARGDVLTVDGKRVAEPEPVRVWRYHKPVGLMTTHADPLGRPTVFEALPKSMPRVISVGRLDINSEGLLLLTNDGGLSRNLEMPATGLMRRYRARARGRTTQEELDRLKDGLTVDGVAYGPIEAVLDKAKAEGTGANLWITVTLSEGKNREVRKVLEALGLTVNRLIRQAYGPFQLGALAPGEVEEVGPRVIREQLSAYIAPEKLPSGTRTPEPARKAAPTKAQPKVRGTGGAVAEPAGKLVYKQGWAKPKKRPNAASKAKRKPAVAAGPARYKPRERPGIHGVATSPTAPARPAPRPGGPRRPGPGKPGSGGPRR
jgi:23S rRNA pseudouridine2605 synthase